VETERSAGIIKSQEDAEGSIGGLKRDRMQDGRRNCWKARIQHLLDPQALSILKKSDGLVPLAFLELLEKVVLAPHLSSAF
jgi:hypothetical protein